MLEPTDQEFVKSVWKYVKWESDYDIGTRLSVNCQRFSVNNSVGNPELYLRPEDEVCIWHKARLYTEDHLKQVAELKYELSLQKLFLNNYQTTPEWQRNHHDHQADSDAVSRTISRLQEILNYKMQGMSLGLSVRGK